MKNFKLIVPFSEYPSEDYIALAHSQDAEAIKAHVCKKFDFSDFGMYRNDKYSVTVYPVNGTDEKYPLTVYLKIRDNDWSARHDWRDFQEIKNDLVGRECEGVELYPAESRKVDGANQFHIWVINDEQFRFPFGFKMP